MVQPSMNRRNSSRPSGKVTGKFVAADPSLFSELENKNAS